MIIGLMGEIGAGKDTAAQFLVESYGFKRLAFADPLKDMCAAMFGLSRASFDDRFIKEDIVPHWGISRREMAQQAGTEMVRNMFGKDHWVRRLYLEMIKDFSASLGVAEDYVITDCRFQNEVDFILGEGGWIWTIIRPNNPLLNLVKNKQHASEVQNISIPVEYNWIFNNGGTREEFKDTVLLAYKHLKEAHDKVIVKLKSTFQSET